jgi:general secretion pathway protein G
MRTPERRQEGFTLIEILVVILVLGVLAALVAPSVFQHVGSSRETAARSQIEMIGSALDAYRLDNDYYPSTDQGLSALRVLPVGDPPPRNWRGPYLKKDVPMDPWGHAYVYRNPPADSTLKEYDLITYGRDGREGGSGEDADIRN